MALHWLDKFNDTLVNPPSNDKCGFLCDTTSTQPLCCDEIWVPPLRLPGCTVNAIQSVTPTPYLRFELSNTTSFWRRFWYLNIDATCAVKADFHNFPFDVQKLTIDVINPYASRTWFQLNKGFLKHNVREGIAGIDLNPDRKTAGWDVKDLLVASSCGTQESWLQTFLTQDYLLSILSDHTKPTYSRQNDSIMDALNPDINLECAEMKSVEVQWDLLSNPAYVLPYITASNDYDERVNSTLQRYRDCVETSEYNFYLNTTTKNNEIDIPGLGRNKFDVSEVNINRSFGLLDLTKQQPTKVSFQCVIAAVANLTTPGIRITILVQRFRKFYIVKLILPAVACVAFSFTAFGLRPGDLMGRLTVVVPSAIALTALQGLVVSSDIPAVAYIAPTTYIMLISYLVQLLIAFESVSMSIWLIIKKRRNINDPNTVLDEQSDKEIEKQRNHPNSWRRLDDANAVLDELQGKETELHIISRDGGRPSDQGDTSNGGSLAGEPAATPTTLQPTHPAVDPKIIKYDLLIMAVLVVGYIMAIIGCTVAPWLRSHRVKSTLAQQYVNMWDDP